MCIRDSRKLCERYKRPRKKYLKDFVLEHINSDEMAVLVLRADVFIMVVGAKLQQILDDVTQPMSFFFRKL